MRGSRGAGGVGSGDVKRFSEARCAFILSVHLRAQRPVLSCIEKPYTDAMKTITLPPSIPVSPDIAARFAALSEEEKRIVRMRVAIEIGRLSKRNSRAESAAEFRAATAAIGNQARRKGLSLTKLKRMIRRTTNSSTPRMPARSIA